MKNNLFRNGNFKKGTRDWSLQTISSLDSNNWPSGTLGSGAANFTQSLSTTSEALEGKSSGKWTKTNVNAQRQGFQSEILLVDKELRGNVVKFEFSYNLTQDSGTLSLTGVVATHDIKIALYDITNSAWIQPSGHLAINSVGVQALASGEFQMPFNTTQVNMVIFQATTSTAGWTLIADQFFFGKVERVYGGIGLDSVPVIMSLTNAGNAVVSATMMRTNERARFRGRITIGSTLPTGAILINLPAGLVTDIAKIQSVNNMACGIATTTTGSYLNTQLGHIEADTSTRFAIRGPSGTGLWTATVPYTFAAGYLIDFDIDVAIVGWSSGTIISSDADTRVLSMRISGSASGTLSAAFNKVTLATVSKDSHAMYSSGTATIKVPGDYSVKARFRINGTTVLGGQDIIAVYKNGVLFSQSSYVSEVAGIVTGPTIEVSDELPDLKVGDTIEIYSFTNRTGAVFTNNTGENSFALERISGPATIAASESVNMAAVNTSGQSIPNNTTTTITGWTKDFDDMGFFNATTGIFTALIPGKYSIKASTLYVPTGSPPFNTQWSITASKNSGAVTRRLDFTSTQVAGALAIIGLSGGYDFKLLVGDTLQLTTFQNSGSAQTIDVQTQIAISRIGN